MKKYQIGFIGCGNMGRAMLTGALKKEWTSPERIGVHTHSKTTMDKLEKEFGIQVEESNRMVAENSQIIILAVKPNIYKDVLLDIKEVLEKGQILVVIAPAYGIGAIEKLIAKPGVMICRAMPNTPAQVAEGMTGLCFSDDMPEEIRESIQTFFESFGKVARVREETMAAVGSVSGSSPAFVYMVIEGMAEGAIKLGIPAKDAYVFAAQSVLGAAEMVLKTENHPAVLRDAVCSAGGTTIEGVACLEKAGLKAALIEAMDRSAEKFQAMETSALENLS